MINLQCYSSGSEVLAKEFQGGWRLSRWDFNAQVNIQSPRVITIYIPEFNGIFKGSDLALSRDASCDSKSVADAVTVHSSNCTTALRAWRSDVSTRHHKRRTNIEIAELACAALALSLSSLHCSHQQHHHCKYTAHSLERCHRINQR
ncbi:Protein MEN-8 [Senna tora]|uniref:Protein MEN-8 n=1 Tax=Senna tora TaxID=362788 RepID=A0A834TEZ4_9FABA|nr:Protein MEN-8 [Senna tora]